MKHEEQRAEHKVEQPWFKTPLYHVAENLMAQQSQIGLERTQLQRKTERNVEQLQRQIYQNNQSQHQWNLQQQLQQCNQEWMMRDEALSEQLGGCQHEVSRARNVLDVLMRLQTMGVELQSAPALNAPAHVTFLDQVLQNVRAIPGILIMPTTRASAHAPPNLSS